MFSTHRPIPNPPARPTAGAKQPAHEASEPWVSADVAYVGQEVYSNMGGCSQRTPARGSTGGFLRKPAYTLMAANAQGHSTPIAATRETYRTPTADLGRHASQPVPRRTSSSCTPATVPVQRETKATMVSPSSQPAGGRHYRVEGLNRPKEELQRARPVCGGYEHARYEYDSKEGCKPRPQHKTPDTVATRATICKHPGCARTPRYGLKDAPLSFCQSHKRAGMYTNRNGKALIATRDGNAFRSTDSATTTNSPSVPGSTSGDGRNFERTTDNANGAGHRSFHAGATHSPSSTRLGPLYRKLCEVTGCQVQPSYGPSGTNRPRFCSEHKKTGMVGLKNRPCLFPGCITRPHYGLSLGRPVYCAKHKKKDMVHLLKESMLLEKERIARNRAASRKAVAARKAREAEESEAMVRHETVGAAEGGETQAKSRHGEAGNFIGKEKSPAAARGCNDEQGGAAALPEPSSPEFASSSSSFSSPSSPSSRSTSPSMDDEAAEGSGTDSLSAQSATSPRSSRVTDTSGMAPSVEIQLLKKAREAARAEAEASGSGRRARAPSRKLLEASGVLKNDCAQWMTKEIKEADLRLKRDLREQRKRFRSVGLKAGQVIEELAVPQSHGIGGVGGIRWVVHDRGNAKFGDNEVGASSPSMSDNWRKLTTSEILRQAGKQLVEEVAAAAKDDAAESLAPATGNAQASPKKRPWSLTDTASGTKKESAGTDLSSARDAKRTKTTSEDEDGTPALDAGKERTHQQAEDGDDCEGSAGGKCEHGGCNKVALFGVNGTVRYCKTHRLFGMYKIADNN